MRATLGEAPERAACCELCLETGKREQNRGRGERKDRCHEETTLAAGYGTAASRRSGGAAAPPIRSP